jgi:hypothetical protein
VPKPPADPAPEIEPAIDALYQSPLDRFTAERNALAAALKQRGDKAGAARVKGLAKPTLTAWAMNQVWWRHRERFAAMLEAGAAQRQAHLSFAQGRKADVRAAGEARRQAVREVTDAAYDVLGGQKQVAPDVQYRIAGTAEALASSGVPEGETLGRLTRDLQSSGLDALTALADAAGARPRPSLVPRSAPSSESAAKAPPATASAVAPARGSARERQARERTEAAARAHAEQVAEARRRVEDLTAALETAARAADAAAAAEDASRAALAAATAERAEREAALDEARAAEAGRRRELSEHSAAASRAELDRARATRDLARAREALERLDTKGR